MMNNKNLKKIPLYKRIYQHIDFSVSLRWDNLIIALLIFFSLYLLTITVGLIDLNFNIYSLEAINEATKSIMTFLKKFFIIQIFIILFLLRKVPLKIMANQVIIFAVFLSIAMASAFLCRINLILLILVSLFWNIFFIYTQQHKDLKSIGAFTLITYIFYLNMIIPLEECSLRLVIKSMLLIFISTIIASIPMFIVRILQKDPYKKELISSLFKKENNYYELNNIKKSILNFDQSNYTKNLINIAEELFIYNSILNSLSLNLDQKNKINQFTAEIDELIKKIRFTINNSLENCSEININQITEFYKNIDYELDSKNINQSFLNFMVKKYKNTFEKLNDIFTRKSLKDNINLNKLNINPTLNTDTIEFRYSLRFVLVFLICVLWDILTQNWKFTATLLAFFTLTTNLIFNNEVFIIRVYATVLSVIIGIGTLILCSFLNITYIMFSLSVLIFLLYFLLKDNFYRGCSLFLLGFILWTPQNAIKTANLFIVNGIISITTIIIVSNLILPKKSQNNLIDLFISKLDLIEESITEFYTQGLKEDTLKGLIENNNKINDVLNQLNNKYEDITEDITLFYKLNYLLNSYGDKFNSLKLITDNEEIEYNYKNMINEVINVLNSFKNVLKREKTNDEYLDLSYKQNKTIENETFNFIYPLLKSIILDSYEIYDILMKLEDENLIEKYDTDLIRNIFNLKDIIKKD